ncbi:MAG: SUMF1/EgtB/PvdO family nonheme iron enzyme [Fuerstiella sp.]|nr:SUMF1/EgtB/PvdO family nonheme iron enzyme [Fuerstiella sp.]
MNGTFQSLACTTLLFAICSPQGRPQELPVTAPQQILTNSIGMKLAEIPAGEFLMGSPDTDMDANDDEKPQHPVKITEQFFMGVYEVTQEEYEKVVGTNPSFFAKTGRGPEKVVGLNTKRFPVEFIQWEHADAFCTKLSELPAEKTHRRVYRLPTEAEWEYACRAGKTTSFHFGETLSSTQANFNGKLPSPGTEIGPFLGRPTTVGSYEPNEFGLYDMHGNVSEWCADQYHEDYYSNSPADDPLDEAGSSDRVVRGGNWGSDAMNCRSRYRFNVLPVRRYQSRGFRILMRLGEKPDSTDENVTETAEETELDEKNLVFQTRVRPLINSYCIECHAGAEPAGDIALDQFEHLAQVATTGRNQWKRVRDQLLAHAMPPEDKRQLDDSAIDFVTQWINTTLSNVDCDGPGDPGHESIRRLTQNEYRNTIRDLLGVNFDAADDFPADDTGATGDALSLPPILMETYLAAAEQITAEIIASKQSRAEDNLRHRIFFTQPNKTVSREQAAHKILERLMSRAFRRPVTDLELERILRLVVDRAHEQGDSFEESIELAIQAILVSPHFLFKVETDPQPNDSETARSLNEYELATRMSYFLWSSMPDDELLKHARQQTLTDNITDQVARMLNDPKAQAIVRDFGGQTWLQLQKLESITPDKRLFPEFDDELRHAMRTESEMFFAAIMQEDRSILDFIAADFTFVNQRLARHYGITKTDLPEFSNNEFQRISLGSDNRGGVLTQASILTLTSNPNRTSPVKRGKWIMENILGTPPAAPPPGVSEFVEGEESVTAVSLRKKMELHRKMPRCAVCHEQMDSLGFAMENFDAVGRWRTHEAEIPIDSSGVLPDGTTFHGPGQLKTVLREHRQEQFIVCFLEKMLGYALGRELEYFDQCTVDQLATTLSQHGYRFSSLVTQIVESEPFQKRRGRRASHQ